MKGVTGLPANTGFCDRTKKLRRAKGAAKKEAKRVAHGTGLPIEAYKCRWCRGWHIGKNPQKMRSRP